MHPMMQGACIQTFRRSGMDELVHWVYLRADLSNRQVLSVAIRHQERAIAASGAKSAIHGSQPSGRK